MQTRSSLQVTIPVVELFDVNGKLLNKQTQKVCHDSKNKKVIEKRLYYNESNKILNAL